MTTLTTILANVDEVHRNSLRECDSAYAESVKWLNETLVANQKTFAAQSTAIGLSYPTSKKTQNELKPARKRRGLQTVGEAEEADETPAEKENRSLPAAPPAAAPRATRAAAVDMVALDPAPPAKRRSSGDGADVHAVEEVGRTRRAAATRVGASAPASPEPMAVDLGPPAQQPSPEPMAVHLEPPAQQPSPDGGVRAAEGSDEGLDVTKLNVKQLREELKARDLSTRGLKAELVARLEEALAQAAAGAPAPSPRESEIDWAQIAAVGLKSNDVSPRQFVPADADDGAASEPEADATDDVPQDAAPSPPSLPSPAAAPAPTQTQEQRVAQQARRRRSDIGGAASSTTAAPPAEPPRAPLPSAAPSSPAAPQQDSSVVEPKAAEAGIVGAARARVLPTPTTLPLPSSGPLSTLRTFHAPAAQTMIAVPEPPAQQVLTRPSAAPASAAPAPAVTPEPDAAAAPRSLVDSIRLKLDTIKATTALPTAQPTLPAAQPTPTPASAPQLSAGSAIPWPPAQPQPAPSAPAAHGVSSSPAQRPLSSAPMSLRSPPTGPPTGPRDALAGPSPGWPAASPSPMRPPPPPSADRLSLVPRVSEAPTAATRLSTPGVLARDADIADAEQAALADGHAADAAVESQSPRLSGGSARADAAAGDDGDDDEREQLVDGAPSPAVAAPSPAQPGSRAQLADVGMADEAVEADEVELADADADAGEDAIMQRADAAAVDDAVGLADIDVDMAADNEGMPPRPTAPPPPPPPPSAAAASSNLLSDTKSFLPLVRSAPPPPPPPASGKAVVEVKALKAAEKLRKQVDVVVAPPARGGLSAVARAVGGAVLSAVSGGARAPNAAEAAAEARKRRVEEVLARKREEDEARARALDERERVRKERELGEAKRKAEEEETRKRKVQEAAEERSRRIREDTERRERALAEREAERKEREDLFKRKKDFDEAELRKKRLGADAQPAVAPPPPSAAAAIPPPPAPSKAAAPASAIPPPPRMLPPPPPAASLAPPSSQADGGALGADGRARASGSAGSGYCISEHKSSDGEEEEEEEGEEQEEYVNPAKKIPAWAAPGALSEALERQLTADPDDIFSNVETCDLVDIFAPPGKPAKERYNRRGSSGNWKADQLTWKEVHEYNQAMGYYKGQQG